MVCGYNWSCSVVEGCRRGGGGNFHFISPIDFPQEPGPIRYIQPLYTVRRGDTGADTSMHKEFKVQAAFTIHVCIYCILINSVHVQYMQCSLFMYTNIFSIKVVSVHTTVLYIYWIYVRAEKNFFNKIYFFKTFIHQTFFKDKFPYKVRTKTRARIRDICTLYSKLGKIKYSDPLTYPDPDCWHGFGDTSEFALSPWSPRGAL